MTLGIVLPAAGASSRMRGRDKLLEEVDGVPLLLRQTRRALNLGLSVLVTLPTVSGARAASLGAAGTGLETRPVADAAAGISASLRVAAHWAMERDLGGLMIVLPDMPDLTSGDMQAVAAAHADHPHDVIRATDEDGQFGHPTLLPARLLPALVTLRGDTGAREVIAREKIRPCTLGGTRATMDLDTPEAWKAWRAARD
ncbi:NTP transferase domain-containing protein [Roseovarius atlanticus]|uniref:nucleotidyltransferase family protein n=1 Tax=Roseovarius atlanticus TaxID=1641875 RepID=UPI001C946F96|nr:NTP transferase domain-containing protein [Roseovarius atlanticus]MBY5988581.1 NTP transferase domain-containing protein [Roseovarius atlanticus]MBY6123971.1 NTP transferase domain-containing protein [Roseovarius atlanticus]MBY6148466.1 NTP transferase domain-containing protein [Roseovarius atlanticus]